MPNKVAFHEISTAGLEGSAFPEALAGLRAQEARYFKNKHDADFTVSSAAERPDLVDYVAGVLADERGIVIESPVLEVAELSVDGIRWTHAFYASGLAVNVLYTLDAEGAARPRRAVGFKLCEGMEVPGELAERFKFARQKSALAGTIRGTYFVIKGEY